MYVRRIRIQCYLQPVRIAVNRCELSVAPEKSTPYNPLQMSLTDTNEILLRTLVDVLGPDSVLTGNAVAGYATDVYRSRVMPIAVLRPTTIEQLQCAVRTATVRLSPVRAATRPEYRWRDPGKARHSGRRTTDRTGP